MKNEFSTVNFETKKESFYKTPLCNNTTVYYTHWTHLENFVVNGKFLPIYMIKWLVEHKTSESYAAITLQTFMKEHFPGISETLTQIDVHYKTHNKLFNPKPKARCRSSLTKLKN